jgi:hypothetical protein
VIPFELVADGAAQRNFETIARLLSVLTEIPFYVGTGSPNGVVTASPPAIYFNRSGGAGTTVYLKESGTATNVGWVGK